MPPDPTHFKMKESKSKDTVLDLNGKLEGSLVSAARNYDYEKIKSAVLEHLEQGNGSKNVLPQLQSALHEVLSDEFQGHIKEDAMLKCISVLIEFAKTNNSDYSEKGLSPLAELVNAKQNGESPLSTAVHHGFERAADILVQCGADTAVPSPRFRGHHSLATKIANTMPDVMMHILDSGIEWEEESNVNDEDLKARKEKSNGNDEDLKARKEESNVNDEDLNARKEDGELTRKTPVVKLNWRPILQYSLENENQGKRNPKYLQEESSFLYSLLNIPPNTRNRYLTHPLVCAFLYLKRCTISKKLKGMQFILSTFPVFYMVFMYFLYFNRCKMEQPSDESENSTTKAIIRSSDEPNKERQRCDITLAISVAAYLLSAFVGGCALFEVYMFLKRDTTYMKSWRTWVIRVSIVVMACTLWPALQFNTLYNITWQYPIAAIGTFLAWTMCLIQMELVPQVKVYLEMLVAVIISVLKITLLFLPLLIGFYMGFYLMYFKFGNIMNFILMTVDIGSNEYEDMLDNPKDERAYFKAIAYGFSAVFIVVIGIVFINFLLGASINDIQELRQMAKIMTLSNKVQNHYIVDLIFSRRYNVVHAKDVTDVAKNELRWILKPNEIDGILYQQKPGLDIAKLKYNFPKNIRDSLTKLLKSKTTTVENGYSLSTDASRADLTVRMDRLENRMNSVIHKQRSDDD